MQLSAQNLSLLLEEISAMVAADRPIAAGLFELGDRSLGRLGRAARQIALQIESGESAESAISSVSGPASQQVSTAFRLLEKVGSAAPIRCVARSIQSRQEAKTQLAIAAIYPAMTLMIAYAIVVWLFPWLVFSEAYQSLGIADIDGRILSSLAWLQSNFWIPPAIALVVGLVCFFELIPVASRLEGLGLGTARRDEQWALFCDMMALEIEAGVPTPEAIASAASATGETGFSKSAIAASAHLSELGSREDPSGRVGVFFPPLLRWSLERALSASSAVQGQSSELRMLADWYRDQAHARNRFWIEWFPVLATVVVMTLLIALMVMSSFVPLYSLLALINFLG